MLYDNILQAIGKTPLVKLKDTGSDSAEIYAKVESRNPSGSVKDRAALYIIKDLMDSGQLEEGGTIIEATSGNTGIAVSMIGAAMGLRVIIVMPETMTLERRRLMQAYGAELVLTGEGGMEAAVAKAKDLSEELGAPLVGQFERQANVQAHIETTAHEILEDLEDLNGFVAGIGSGGTVSGVGQVLKNKEANIKVWGVEPASSPMLNEGRSGSHKIQGLGANFVPEIYRADVVDKVAMVTDEEAQEGALYLSRQEGILSGMSAGANYTAAKRLAKELGEGKKVVVILPDSGERYLSSGMFDD